LSGDDAGAIVVSGSHGGASAAEFALAVPLAAVFFNDGASMSASAKPANTETAATSPASAAQALATACRIAPESVVLRRVSLMSGRRFRRTKWRRPSRRIASRSRPARSPVSYMSMGGDIDEGRHRRALCIIKCSSTLQQKRGSLASILCSGHQEVRNDSSEGIRS